MIKHEFLAKYGLSQNQLAKALGISPNRIADIIANRRAGLGLCASRETVRR
jgi:plasmid maintenance system antidote protein VapI